MNLPQRRTGHNNPAISPNNDFKYSSSSSSSSSSSLLRKGNNNRRHVAVVIALFLSIIWICISFLTFQHLPDPSKRDIHSVVLSNCGGNRLSSTTMTTATKQNNKGYDARRKHLTLSPYRIVHSLTTRFMVGQPNQPILARARYLLFETFCWPTIQYQSALPDDYSWFVLADPGIDQEVIADLRALLSYDKFPKGNAYLILTDEPSWAADGVGVPGVTSYGASFQEIAQGVRNGKVKLLTGNATRLIQTLEYSIEGKVIDDSSKNNNTNHKNEDNKPLLLIETMLDADDGLNNHGIEWIQDLAVSHTQQQQEIIATPPTLNSTWWILCGTDHIEWHNRDIFRLTDSEYQEIGLTSGITGIRHAPQYCASAGFTRVGLTTTAMSMTTSINNNNDSQQKFLVFPQVAYSNHALATENFDLCDDVKNITLARCFRRDFSGLPFILKSRSITSDSMDHMDPKREDYRDLPWEGKMDHPLLINETERIWRILQDDFSINRLMAWETSMYLRENLQSIIQENKNSRCAPGFPCREVADVTFKKMSAHIMKMNKMNLVDATKNKKTTR
ncbi:MAG: hypothetical protein ACI8RD_006183 [Bacillariaceae sp.]|jgi:hypothetical protein